MANNAPTPDGYALAFSNLSASLQASNYMGLYTLTSYDTLTCASKCDQANCSAFNVYLERDPTLNASAQNCPNPPSTTNFKCTLWGLRCLLKRPLTQGNIKAPFTSLSLAPMGITKSPRRLPSAATLALRNLAGRSTPPKYWQLYGISILSLQSESRLRPTDVRRCLRCSDSI